MGELREQFNLHKERRRRHIKNLIEESVINVLAEQEAAQQPPAPPPPAQETPPPVATPSNQAPKQYTVDDMIDELNAIRGGRSFTDPEVYGRLVTFFKNLGDEQKSDLDTLLTQIAELVTGVDDSPRKQQAGDSGQSQPTPPSEAPQQSAPMPGAQPAAGAAGVGAV